MSLGQEANMPRVADLTEKDIERAFYAADGELTRAAEVLGVHRATLWKRMRELGMRTKRRTIIDRAPATRESA